MQVTTPAPSHVLLRGWLRGWGGLLCVIAIGYTFTHWLWLYFKWGGSEEAVTLIGNLAWIPMNLLVIALAARAARRSLLPTATRRAWGLIALAYGANLLGDVVFLGYETQGLPTFPSWADAAYLAVYPLLLAAILSFPTQPLKGEERVTFWLDAAIVLVGGGMVLWHLVLLPTATSSYGGWLEAALSFAYPAADLVLLFGIATIALRPIPAAQRLTLLLLMVTFALNNVGDIGYSYLSLQGSYVSGDWPDALWMLALLVLATSAQVQWATGQQVDEGQGAEGDQTRLLAGLPYAAIALGYGLLLYEIRDQWRTPLANLIDGAVLLTALVVVRQMAAIRVARRAQTAIEQAKQALEQANSDLEARVAERTATLAEALARQEAQARELAASLVRQQELYQTVNALSVPLIPLRDDVLVVPLIGQIDQERARRVVEVVLQQASATRARQIFLDLTGVAMVDREVAQLLISTASSLRLLGAQTILVGISPEVAQALVHLGIDLSAIETAATLQTGIKRVLAN